MRLARLGEGHTRQPIDGPFDVDRCGGDQVLQSGFDQPSKATATHPQRHRTLRHCAFDASPDFVTLLELICLLISPGLLNCLVFFLGAHIHKPTVGFGLGALEAMLARLTILTTKADGNNWFLGSIQRGMPIDTGFAQRTGNLLAGPINPEV